MAEKVSLVRYNHYVASHVCATAVATYHQSGDYLEADRASEFRNEYYNGRMYPIAGGTQVRGIIIFNFGALLWQAIRGRGCIITADSLRLRISYAGLYTYPDLMVVCGQTLYADDKNDTVLNPTLIVVLSASTETHDRVFKFRKYGKLDSLQEYILVEQRQPRVERYQRQAKGQWLLSEYDGLEAEAHLESVGGRIRLAEIYETSGSLREGSATTVAV